MIKILILFINLLFYSCSEKKTDLIIQNKYFSDSKYINVDNVWIHYLQYIPEKESKYVVVFIHGLAGSTFSFRNNYEILKTNNIEYISFDLPGFGYSARVKDFNHSQSNRALIINKALEKIINSTNNRELILVGHSMGGGTVLELALLNDKIRKIIIVDGAFKDRKSNLFSDLFLYFIDKFALNRDTIKNLLKSAYGRYPDDYEIEGYLRPLLIKDTILTFKDMIRTSRNPDTNFIEKINIPSLIIWGEKDSWVNITNEGYLLTNLIKNSKLVVISNSYHCPMETHYKEFNEVLINFITNY